MHAVASYISSRIGKTIFAFAAVAMAVSMAFGQAATNASDLSGTVSDPNGAVVSGATVTARNSATGFSRNVTTGTDGSYTFIGLPPGDYEITAEAPTFKKTVISPVRLTVGQVAQLGIKMEIGGADITINVSGDSVELIEPGRTSLSNTIDSQRVQNLPINERSATGFALTLSTVGRDNGRPIGPAPTSGLNIGGQRGRSTQVNVDGADFTDNSINAARSTVSMEAVQEYQVNTNSYTAEFGRATGGVVNVVTKRGTNSFSGNVFGFIRDKSIQATNAFSPIENPDFRRTQWGATLGGPIIKDKTFFFAAYERRQRDESGFFTSDVVGNLTASASIPGIAVPGFTVIPVTFSRLTPQQAGAITGLVTQGTALLGAGNPQGGALICAARAYGFLASSGGITALTGSNSLASPNDGSTCGNPISPILPGTIGPRFFLTGAPVPSGTANADGLPIAFRPLNNLERIFPVTERANYFSVRGDHAFNNDNHLTMRFGYNTGNQTGIQVESQNQSLGQNDFSRTGITELEDTSFGASLNTTLSSTMANEFKFSYGRRHTTFRSQNGDAVAFNISGTAFIGRELFSPVDRTEHRTQFADNFNWVLGDHTLKFGGDFNFVRIPSAVFELNFAGLFNFGEFAASNLNANFAPLNLPNLTPVQSYGLGMPSTYIQGFGNPISKIKNTPLAFYAQDSWKIMRRLTLNYGVRYDVELTETIAPVGIQDPLTGITLSDSDILAAQDAVGVQQGIPRDLNNWAPRFGFAFDTFGNGKTILRGSIGLYYDHPLLAVAFNSDIADASQQQQSVLTAGNPSPTQLLNAAQVFQGTVCVPGATPTAFCAAAGNPSTPGVAPSAQYQFGRQRFNDQTYSGFGAVLPFTLPISKDFQYASATQANFGIEQQLTKDMSLGVSYIYVGAHHLPHPTDLNAPDTALQIENYRRCFGTQPTTQQAVSTVNPLLCTNQVAASPIPGVIAITSRGSVISPAIANFFRPNAPNYFLARALGGPTLTKAALDAALAATNSLRTPGVFTPFGAVNAQVSDGNSSYNAMNMELKRRFSNNFTFLASYTWSHSIDDSSDLQTLLIPQDVRDFRAEKANSLFDQRHRFVFSGLVASPNSWRKGSTWQKIFSDFTVAPIIEVSSGRPFNIITNVDANNDQSSQTDRPRLNSDGTLCVPDPNPTSACYAPITNGDFQVGSLGRNMGITHSYASVDLRLTRAIRFGERFRIDLIGEVFNMFNRFNEGSATPFYDAVNAFGERAGNGRFFSRPTASYDPRQFQFGAKFSF